MIYILDFENSQKVDQSKIVCDICKKNNKTNTFKNKFFRCLKCKKDICPLCQNSHIKNESPNYIIDYDQKYFYCELLQRNKISINENELKSCLGLYKEINKYYIGILKAITNKINDVIKESEKLCELKENIIDNYIKSNTDRNYELLMNLKKFHTDLKKIHELSSKIKEFSSEENFNTNIDKIINLNSENVSLPLFTIRPSFDENKCIDTKSLNYGEFAQICDYEKDNKNQIFEMVKGTKEGYYSIRNHFNGFYLGIDSSNNDKKISFKKKLETPQNFKLIDCKNGFYVIEEESNYAVDLTNFIKENGNYIGFSEKKSSKGQQWKLVLI